MLAFGFIPAVPDLADNPRQAVLISREAGAEEALDTVLIIGLRQPFNQPTGSIKRYE